MLLHPGDCFLQPPFIRHRVLECSDELEVVEITCPAEHPTFVDHNMTLPTAAYNPDRDFGGQRFLFHEARDAIWSPWVAQGLEYRDIGIAAVTGGIASGMVVRRTGRTETANLQHNADIRFMFVVAGRAELCSEEQNASSLEAGSAVAIPPGPNISLRALSPEFEALDVIAPAL